MNEGLNYFEDYSLLSLNGHFYKTDSTLRQTPDVGACRFPVISFINYTCYQSATSLRQATSPFETVNRNLRSAYVVKDNVGALYNSKLQLGEAFYITKCRITGGSEWRGGGEGGRGSACWLSVKIQLLCR